MLQDGIMWNVAQGDVEYVTSGPHEQIQSDNPIQSGGKYWEGWSMCANHSLALGGQISFWICRVKDDDGPIIFQQYYSNFDPIICGRGTLNWSPALSPSVDYSPFPTTHAGNTSIATFSADLPAASSSPTGPESATIDSATTEASDGGSMTDSGATDAATSSQVSSEASSTTSDIAADTTPATASTPISSGTTGTELVGGIGGLGGGLTTTRESATSTTTAPVYHETHATIGFFTTDGRTFARLSTITDEITVSTTSAEYRESPFTIEFITTDGYEAVRFSTLTDE